MTIGKPFAPGKSGNPGGRPRDEVKGLARQHGPEAINKLVEWMRSGNAKASVSAATALLDRGWGKPTQPVSGDDDAAPIIHEIRRTIVRPHDPAPSGS